MSRTRRHRLQKLSDRIDAMPLAPAAEEAAFERFRETGELPDRQRLAEAVVKRALRGETVRSDIGSLTWQEKMEQLSLAADELRRAADEATPERISFREQLFAEAIHEDEVIRLAARATLKVLVAMGEDVTDSSFLGKDVELPDYGSAGLHFLGFPECLARPPHEEQAHRLFDRFAVLRDRIDRDDRGWFEEFDRAASRFLQVGELPEDELMREAVLGNAELTELLRCLVGDGDPEVMAAFDRAARAAGPAREAAIAGIRGLFAEGRFAAQQA